VSSSRVLGLDVGHRRIGVAVSDSAGRLAVPVGIVERSKDDPAAIAALVNLAEEYGVSTVVVGDPIGLTGTPGAASERIADFREALCLALASRDIAVHAVDERFTTVTATARLREAGLNAKQIRSRVDASAAVVIVEQWLEAAR